MSDLDRQVNQLPDETLHKEVFVKIVRQLDRTQALVWGMLGAALGAYIFAPLVAHGLLEIPWSMPTPTALRVLLAVVGFLSWARFKH